MDGLAHHVVDARGEQRQGLLQGAGLVEGDDRRPAERADRHGAGGAVGAVADQEAVDRLDVDPRRGVEPVLHGSDGQTLRRHALGAEAGDVLLGDALPLVDNDVHRQCSKMCEVIALGTDILRAAPWPIWFFEGLPNVVGSRFRSVVAVACRSGLPLPPSFDGLIFLAGMVNDALRPSSRFTLR
jgi:hypothetical protein